MPPSPDGNEPLHVAIAGAGIAGLAAAVALSRHPRIDIQLYDKATALREIGASIALGPNGLRTLEKLGVGNALDDDVAFRGPSGLPMIYRLTRDRHWKTNEIISFDEFKNVPDRRHQTARFARAHLHQSLLQHVSPERIHLGKKIVAVEERGAGVILKFADGTEAVADLLVGADGINSWGPTGSVFASRLGKGQFTTVSSVQLDPEDPKNKDIVESSRWDDLGDINHVRELHKDWHPVIQDLFARTPAVRVYPNLAITAPLPSYTFLRGRVALIGDAAHPHGGAFATGGSLAIDDAYALSLALFSLFPVGSGRARPSPEELARATAVVLY
ncbi:putative salicylate hydroxylase protein [Neofusicoccum parvum UCRNP2]|uniref:Putative salicylate hydroxylase protein n=1 Tax=Botryosphaeria parva (strain UCR-NP2) TaxID=1287680 RepID=R1GDK1_BOTPV|nr:putative salicylate hydroxylase protein [Neofusicoccum parvum UCRNP2]